MTSKFDNQLRLWSQAQRVPLDWLFISHFDTDHVSGMDTLMARTVVNDVMVPYLNEEEMMFTLLHEVSRDTLTRPFVEIASDPAAFFLSRGARRVTYLAGEGGHDEDDDATAFDPDPPEERGSWFTKISRPTRRLPAPSWAAGSQSSPRIRVIDGGLADIAVTNGSVGLRLKPHRVPISTSAHGGLVSDIRALVGSVGPTSTRRPGLGNLAFAVANHARTAIGRKALRAVFKTYVGSSNRASLSLLSQPVIPDSARGDWWVDSGSRVMWRGRFRHANVPAWLNTGDAELLPSCDLSSWQSAYAAELSDVQVLALPHHGSDKNSDAAFQSLAPDALLVAHVKSTSSKHPGTAVAHFAGSRLACVTEDVGSWVGMQFHVW